MTSARLCRAFALAAFLLPAAAEALFEDRHSTSVELAKTALDFFNSGNQDKGLDNIERALERDPENETIRYNYALMLFRMGRYVNARDQAKRVLRDHPRHPKALQLYFSAVEAIRKTPGAADPDVLGKVPTITSGDAGPQKQGEVPEEVRALLAALYLDHDFAAVWEAMCIEAQTLLPKDAYVKSSAAAWEAEKKNGRTLDVRVEGFETNGDRAMVRFAVHTERPTPPDLSEALGGDSAFTERVREVIFLKRENFRWRFFPASIFTKSLAEFHLAFRNVHLQAGVEINYKAQWFDKNLFLLDRIENVWKRRNPAKSTNARLMKRVLEYWGAIRRGDLDAAYDMLSKFSKNHLTPRFMREFYGAMNLIDIQPGAVQVAEPNARCEFAVVSISVDPARVEVHFLKLVSSLYLVYEDAEWKIVDYTLRQLYREKRKADVAGLPHAEDQFAVFNGRDWIDASADYRESLAAKLKEMLKK